MLIWYCNQKKGGFILMKQCWFCKYFNNSEEDKERCAKCMKSKDKPNFKLWIEEE